MVIYIYVKYVAAKRDTATLMIFGYQNAHVYVVLDMR